MRVVIHHLEMTDPRQLRPARRPAADLDVRRAEVPCPELSRFLYTAVGGDWYWTDRLGWDHGRWLAWLERPEVETWVAYDGGNPAGYYELEAQPGEQVEIAYLGLLPQFLGRGYGGHLLTLATRRAWQLGRRRVWVHTCSLDHPGALANYRARGFREFRQEVQQRTVAETPPGPWPGGRPAGRKG